MLLTDYGFKVSTADCNSSSSSESFFQVLPDLSEDQAQSLEGRHAHSCNQKIKVDPRAKNTQEDEEEKRQKEKGEQYTKLPP